MDVITSHKIILVSVLPFLTALSVMITTNRPGARVTCFMLGSFFTIYLLYQFSPLILSGGVAESDLFHMYPGISVAFRLDGIGFLFAGTVSVIWMLTGLYSIAYMRIQSEYVGTQNFMISSAIVGGALGVALSGNLFTLFLFYLLTTVLTYFFIPYKKERTTSEQNGRIKIYSFYVSKVFLASALIMIYSECGTLDFSAEGILEGMFTEGSDTQNVVISFYLCIAGFLHTPVMLLFKKADSFHDISFPGSLILNVAAATVGVYAICRVMLSLYGVNLLMETHLGLMTVYFFSAFMILTSVTALMQTHLYSRLVHSTISHLSLIILGVAILSPQGITGGLIHILNHTFAKAALYFCCGNLIIFSGIYDIRDMKGAGHHMPVTLGAFFLASLVITGIPPFSGFVTVWHLGLGAMDFKNMIVLAVILVFCFLNAVCFLPVFIQAFDQRGDQAEEHGLTRKNNEQWKLVLFLPLMAASAISIYLGIWPDILLDVISDFMGAWEVF